MTTVQTDEPVDEETERHLDMLGRDLGAFEALRDPDVRGLTFAPIIGVAVSAAAVYILTDASTTLVTLLAVVLASVSALMSVKWTDEALCVLRSGYTCHKCEDERERWEVSE